MISRKAGIWPAMRSRRKYRKGYSMDRKETTKFLGELLERQYLCGAGRHWAKEVSIDPGSAVTHRRVDYMMFQPPRQCDVADIEKGIFTCYEVKSCKEDVFSGNGLNFIGEKNYIVTTMQYWKNIMPEYRSGKLFKHIREINPEASGDHGVMIAIPKTRTLNEEFENPTPLNGSLPEWKLAIVLPGVGGRRKRSMVELLFCMLRSGR